MPVSFPTTKRYFVSFRNSDVLLTPTFIYFKRTDTLASVGAPSITELSNGTYYYDVPFTTATDPDYIYQIDGGASIPTEEVRYQTGMASPKDLFLDEPVSQVETAVGVANSHLTDIKGAGFATGTDSLKVVSDNVDTANVALTDIKGAGFATGTDSLKILSDNIDTIGTGTTATALADAVWDATAASHVGAGTTGKLLTDTKTAVDQINVETDPTAIANAVWNEVLTAHITANSGADIVKRVFKLLKNRSKIDTTADTLTVYEDDGLTPLYTFDLKDDTGAASGERPFERVPV